MDTVKVNKTDLLAKLREQRTAHKAEYDEAMVNYRVKAVEELRARLAKIEAGEKVDLAFTLLKPLEYLDSFDEAIAMLEWEQDDTIELDQQDFKRFVLNKWEWQRQFMAATSAYNVR